MLDRTANRTAAAANGADALMKLGREQTTATFRIQRDVLTALDEANRAWLARVKSEVELWSQLAAKLSASRSIPDALRACQDVAARRMQMAADDGKRVSDECQAMIGRITQSMSRGWPSGTT